jgi:8-amino-7-oxononanoate synthase
MNNRLLHEVYPYFCNHKPCTNLMDARHNYSSELKKIQDMGELRVLPDYANCSVDFVSNDYLGLGKIELDLPKFKTHSGMGSRLIAGNSEAARACESFLANFYAAESALVFNSGYTANLGFFSTIPKKDEVVLYDELVHASIRDGLRLCPASSYGFKHNDLLDLENKVTRFQDKKIFVVVEACYSMHGDLADLQGLFALAEQHDFSIIIDEAHSIGVYGEQGKGLSISYSHHTHLLARIITFGKALGAHGAAILGSLELTNYLIHACRAFIYTTALPPEQYARIQAAVQHCAQMDEERVKLHDICTYYAKKMEVSASHIQTINMPDIERIKQIVECAKSAKIALKGVWSPTVPQGQERLRISLHSFNTKEEIDALIELISNFDYA